MNRENHIEYFFGQRNDVVVIGRENIRNVTKIQFISDYNMCRNNNIIVGYSFLRVLTLGEKRRFIDKLEACGILVNCYRTRTIKTKDWIHILENIKLETDYYVYRLSYWGENCGKNEGRNSRWKSRTMVLVRIILGERSEQNAECCGFQRKERKQRINLLIKDNHIDIIDKVIPSIWSNNLYELDNTEDEI